MAVRVRWMTRSIISFPSRIEARKLLSHSILLKVRLCSRGNSRYCMRSLISRIARSKSAVVSSAKLSTSSTWPCKMRTTSSSDFARFLCSRCMPNDICAINFQRGWNFAPGLCVHLEEYSWSLSFNSSSCLRLASALNFSFSFLGDGMADSMIDSSKAACNACMGCCGGAGSKSRERLAEKSLRLTVASDSIRSDSGPSTVLVGNG